MKRLDIQSVEDARELRSDAVQRVYDVFSVYRLRGGVYCVDDESFDALNTEPLEKISLQELIDYSWSDTWYQGRETDFKHFLPRLLELTPTNENFTQDLIRRMLHYKWRGWPDEEVKAIHEFLLLAWEYVLENESASQLSNWLGHLSSLEEPTEDYLLAWMNSPKPRLRLQFAEWLIAGGWTDENIAVPDDIFTMSTVEKLEAQFFEEPEGPYASIFAAAADVARNMMAWNQRES